MNKQERSAKLLLEELEKAKKMPIGTVSKGRKKIAEGKWVEVKDVKAQENIKKTSPKSKTKITNKKQIKEVTAIRTPIYSSNQTPSYTERKATIFKGTTESNLFGKEEKYFFQIGKGKERIIQKSDFDKISSGDGTVLHFLKAQYEVF